VEVLVKLSRLIPALAVASFLASAAALTSAQSPIRARDLGIPFDGQPGPLNAITDVKGVEVGHTTIISGEGKLQVGVGPVRTGVTAVLPRGKNSNDLVFGGWFALNGAGEMTGTTWLEESGFIDGPIMITNTHSVGVVHDAVIKWKVRTGKPDPEEYWWSQPIVAETWDGDLNDANGFHVKDEHAFNAIDTASSGPVLEGAVGGGTGMICHDFKGGIGTASRKLTDENGGFTIGVLVQCNYGNRDQLRVAGVPVGREITEDIPPEDHQDGSIIVVIATDAPLLPHQLKRLAKRASLGLARNGSIASNGSGDIFVAFSTANPGAYNASKPTTVQLWPNDRLSPIFGAAVQATEEAVINALVAAKTMTGANGYRVIGLPHERLREVLRKYNRLVEPARKGQ
jgi:D-aminopeptidase